MDSTFTNLNSKILEWYSQVERTSLNHDDQEELKVHLDDIIHELSELNLSEDEIWILAIKRIGSIALIEDEFEKINPDIRFRKNGILLVYGAVSMLLIQSIFILIPVFYFKKYMKTSSLRDLGNISHFWTFLFYSISVLLIFIILILAFNGRSIIKWLGLVVSKLNVLSAFISVSITIISGSYLIQLLGVSDIDTIGFSGSAFKTLTQIYYLGLIALVGYFLLISSNPGIRSMISFNRKIGWKTALFLGACAGVLVTFGYTYHINNLPLFIGIPLFGYLGWMVSYSKKPLINLFFSQMYIMILLCTGVSGEFSNIFIKYYSITLLALIAGFSYKKICNVISLIMSRLI